MFTKQHCEAIAEILAKSHFITGDSYNDLIDSLVLYFKQDNPNFDSAKFREACGGEE